MCRERSVNSDYSVSNEYDNNSTSIVIVVQAVATDVVLAVSMIHRQPLHCVLVCSLCLTSLIRLTLEYATVTTE